MPHPWKTQVLDHKSIVSRFLKPPAILAACYPVYRKESSYYNKFVWSAAKGAETFGTNCNSQQVIKIFWGLLKIKHQYHPIYLQLKYDVLYFSFCPAVNLSFKMFSLPIYIISKCWLVIIEDSGALWDNIFDVCVVITISDAAWLL
jgi:hypothetical protein